MLRRYSRIEDNLFYSLYLIYGLSILFLLNYLRNKLNFYSMNYSYLRMVKEDLGVIQLERKIYTESWLNNFRNLGFERGYQDTTFVLFYKFDKKLKDLIGNGETLTIVIVAKTYDFNFYSDTVDGAINKLYMDYKNAKKVRRQIVLQFKKYNDFNKDNKKELESVIMFKERANYLINLNVGYFVKNNSVYFLRAKKRYPNKAYYYAVKQICKYCFLDGAE